MAWSCDARPAIGSSRPTVGYVQAAELTADDDVRSLDLPAPAVNADWVIPVSNDIDAWRGKGKGEHLLRLPEVWSDELAHYLGWLIGDGSTSGSTTSTIYGSAEDREEILPGHKELVEWINGGRALKISEQANGTAQLRLGRRAFKRWLEALGVESVTGEHKRVPWSIEQAPPEIVAAFLRGLYDADGCAVVIGTNRYVGLGLDLTGAAARRAAPALDVRDLVAHLRRRTQPDSRSSHTSAPTARSCATNVRHPMTCASQGASVERFAAEIGFTLRRKAAMLRTAVVERLRPAYERAVAPIHLTERIDDGIELTYNLSEPRNHSYVANGVVVRNCSASTSTSTTQRAISPRSTCSSTSTKTATSTSMRSATPSRSCSRHRRSWSGGPTTRRRRSPRRHAASASSGWATPTSARC